MAIGVLDEDPHNFMHDLESFVWVLFWICLHYAGPGKERQDVGVFRDWNIISIEGLANHKRGLVLSGSFRKRLDQHTTDYCRSLIPLVTKLWEEVFPNGQTYEYEDKTLYGRMMTVLKKARDDLIAEEPV
jgi:hypothetical protein